MIICTVDKRQDIDEVAFHLIFGEADREDDAAKILLKKVS